jgi:hypothetical protein
MPRKNNPARASDLTERAQAGPQEAVQQKSPAPLRGTRKRAGGSQAEDPAKTPELHVGTLVADRIEVRGRRGTVRINGDEDGVFINMTDHRGHLVLGLSVINAAGHTPGPSIIFVDGDEASLSLGTDAEGIPSIDMRNPGQKNASLGVVDGEFCTVSDGDES